MKTKFFKIALISIISFFFNGVAQTLEPNPVEPTPVLSYTYYRDSDFDSYGDPNNSMVTFDVLPQLGWVNNSLDCDDTSPLINISRWLYADTDNDGYGNLADRTYTCQHLEGYVTNSTDCDDTNPSINIGETTYMYYKDADGDGFGDPDPGKAILSCNPDDVSVSGYVKNDRDEDDSFNPYPEYPNYISMVRLGSCNTPGLITEEFQILTFDGILSILQYNYAGSNSSTLSENGTLPSGNGELAEVYLDLDRDGYGSGPKLLTCNITEGFSSNNDDCDDTNPDIYPKMWYADADGDGFGAPGQITIACEKPDGYVENNDDDCPDEYGATGGCLLGYAEKMNTVRTIHYDINNKIIGANKVYFDDLGKHIQSQNMEAVVQNTIEIEEEYVHPLTREISIITKDSIFYTTIDRVWASSTLYDEQGRSALNTSGAPVRDEAFFQYNADFVKKSDGATFSKADLGGIDNEGNLIEPSTVGTQTNTLGAYTSTTNTTNPYQDVTTRPYSRVLYDELNPGKTLKVIGGNKIDTDDDGTPDSYPQGFSHSMQAAQELYYAFGVNNLASYIPNNADNTSLNYVNPNILKTVVIDVHGEEVVSFGYADGQALATARSGVSFDNNGVIINDPPQKQVTSLIGEQGFVDIHIPKGCESSLTFIDGFASYKVFDLKTSTLIENESDIIAGVYRIEAIDKENLDNITYINNSGNINALDDNAKGVIYNINYYDYSLNYYDDAGNLTSTLQPLGFNSGLDSSDPNFSDSYANYNLTGEVTHINDDLKSYFKYNTLGQLLETTSPDEGTAWFKYRTDGQIRFSQNSKQKAANPEEFSYTNYDAKERPVESGVASGDYSNLNPDNETFSYTEKREQNFTVYDYLNDDELDSFITHIDEDEQRTNGSDYLNAAFLAGNVAATHNDNGSTYYSYDIYGRVTWMVQKILGLDGVKTIDYEYDDVTGAVTKVYYQKGVTSEQFIHQYTYDEDDYSLIMVETSTDDQNFTVHANYKYYETGGLKRVELGIEGKENVDDDDYDFLQGIDYVYNLNGALKAINHPSLDPAKDPGQDDNDIFGMMIDYHKGDYNRSGVHINTSDFGEDQYNGNIKAVRWNNKATDAYTEDEKAYAYSYNRNNWLTQADFIQGDGAGVTTPTDLVFENDENLSQFFIATNSITAKPETTFTPGAVLRIGEIESAADDYQVSNITYDANGNIQSLKRNQHTLDDHNDMDNMTYHYDPNKPNQLNRVEDAVTEETNAEDIKTQSANNYEYNEIGQLEYNNAEGIAYIYTASGLVSEIKQDNTTLLKFFYNDRGHRVKKESYNPTTGNLEYTDVYVRDAAGMPMAIYRNEQVVEHSVYGSNRIGVYKRIDNSTAYELRDHLGNVRVVVKKNQQETGTDYYPFGMPMPLRNSLSDYRYAYQGQEKDLETGKEAFQLRLWDARIGRWLTTDPYGQYNSPYMGMGNSPINIVDPNGGIGVNSGLLLRTGQSLSSFISMVTSDRILPEALIVEQNKKWIAKPSWFIIAESYLGIKELTGNNDGKMVEKFLATTGLSKGNAWCGAFVNSCVEEVGIDGVEPTKNDHPARALSWRNWGEKIKSPVFGAIAVKSRKGGGHVGFVAGIQSDGKIVILGGNQNDSVNYTAYSSNFTYHLPKGFGHRKYHTDLPKIEAKSSNGSMQ